MKLSMTVANQKQFDLIVEVAGCIDPYLHGLVYKPVWDLKRRSIKNSQGITTSGCCPPSWIFDTM